MIQSALGRSPLEKNARALAAILRSPAPASAARAAAWAARAFRQAGADRVRFERFGPSSRNVLAEIRGRDQPQDYVLFPVILNRSKTGALASAERAAVLIDALRVIHHTGNLPRRSIRFAVFAPGNGAGGRFAGAWAYLRAHGAELDRMAASVSLGRPNGTVNGYSLEDRPDVAALVRQALEPLRSLGVGNFSQTVEIGSSVSPFWLEGIPTLVATVLRRDRRAEIGHDANGDRRTVRSRPLDQLKRRVAIAAVTAYALADAETRIGSRRSPAQVAEAIESLHLTPTLKRSDLWYPWTAARSRPSP